MRSKLIYGALRPVGNRYTLCQLASQATRRFHKPNTRIQDTMNERLTRFSKVEASEKVMRQATEAEKLATGRRLAA
jgi:hypothetical protein